MKHFYKSFLLFAALSLVSVTISGQEPFFSTRQGSELRYDNFDDSGKLICTYSQKITKITGDLKVGSISYDMTFLDENGKPFFGDDDSYMKMDVSLENGNTSAKMYDTGKANDVKDIISRGDVSSIPFNLAVGSVVPNGEITTYIKSFKTYIYVKERSVVSKEKITTKAGTFDCFKMTEKQISKILGFSSEYDLTTWYAHGIGVVKQIVKDRRGRMVSSQELTMVKTGS